MIKLFTKFFVFVAVVAAATMAANATSFPTDGSAFELGKVYDVQAFVDYKATFTAPSTGTLVQEGCPSLKIEGLEGRHLGYTEYGQSYTWEVEAGKTYTIDNPAPVLDDGHVIFYMEADRGVQITSILPADGGILAANTNFTGEILLTFNTAMTYESAVLKCSNVEIELPNNSTLNNTLAFYVTSAMNSMYASGVLNEDGGNAVSVIVNGLRSQGGEMYNGDGVLVLNYTTSAKLAELISTNIPRVIKSYYTPDDPEGIWTFVFDHNLLDDGQTFMTISCGNPMSVNAYYYETLYGTVDGATLTFNMTDKLRDLEPYLMADEMGIVAVKVNNVRDTDGNYAAGGGPGNVGSYDYSLSFNYLRPQTVVCEFNPPSGSSLKDVDEIEIWYNNADLISFDGVEFTYYSESGFKNIVVLKSELQMDLTNNEMTIIVKVPEAVKGHEQITVKLYNMQSIDGYNYRIQGVYDSLTAALLGPIRPGQAIASTGTEDFLFSLNFRNNYEYIRYDFYNAEGPEGWAYGTELVKGTNGYWTAYNNDIPCYNNYEPRMVISTYYKADDFYFGESAAETVTFTFIGTQEPFEYSDVKFVSIDPENFSTITPSEDFCFTVVYDGLVKINTNTSGIILGMGMGVEPFERVEPIYIGEDYDPNLASIWMLYPSQSYLENNSFMDISIFATDEYGRVVEGNLGALEYDCLQFSYQINNVSDLIDVTVDPADFDKVQSLSKFVITCDGMDVDINYASVDVYPRILDSFWNIVYEFTENDFELSSGSLTMTCPEITTDGEYYLSIPERFLIIGEQFSTYYNNFYFGTYTVDHNLSISSIITNEVKCYNVYNLQGIRLLSTPDAEALKALPAGLYIINGKKIAINK